MERYHQLIFEAKVRGIFLKQLVCLTICLKKTVLCFKAHSPMKNKRTNSTDHERVVFYIVVLRQKFDARELLLLLLSSYKMD